MHHDSHWWCRSCKGSINTMASKQNTRLLDGSINHYRPCWDTKQISLHPATSLLFALLFALIHQESNARIETHPPTWNVPKGRKKARKVAGCEAETCPLPAEGRRSSCMQWGERSRRVLCHPILLVKTLTQIDFFIRIHICMSGKYPFFYYLFIFKSDV